MEVASGESLEIAIIRLREYQYDGTEFAECDLEAGVEILRCPGHIHSCPLLGDSPFITKKSRAVNLGIVSEEVWIRDPEESVISECVSQLLHHFRSPFFRTIAPRPIPLLLTPRIVDFQQ